MSEVSADITIPSALSYSSVVAPGDLSVDHLLRMLSERPFSEVYDYIFLSAKRIGGYKAIDALEEFMTRLHVHDSNNDFIDIEVACRQVVTSLRIGVCDFDGALATAAQALQQLAQSPKRKDEAFLSVLAALLYDLAILHSQRGEYRQAERDIEKSLSLLDRLCRHNPERYASAQVIVMSETTVICRSKDAQTALLKQYKSASDSYMERINNGDDAAANLLIDSLMREGETLAKMGKHREAVQYFTRALRYLNQIENEFSLRQLTLSIALGEALLKVKNTRQKGVHLLNTMLHKAMRLQAMDEHRRIVDVLYKAGNSSLDILGFWHKIFPR